MSWYENGLRFKCTGCGACCSKEPGYVWLTDEDIDRLSGHLELSREEFLKRYTRLVNGEYSLLEKPNYDCIFLKENKCSLYIARPKQCRQFPFWPSNLASKKAWHEAANACEGINHKDAPILSHKQIEEWQSQ